MKAPTITAAVRVYNGEDHIASTLDAILGQTRPADEVLVVDDGSTDGTADELRRFGREIRVVRQPNGGYAAAFNSCFAEARGEFVANCDADDVWQPDKLAAQAEALAAHPEVDLAFAAAELFGRGSGPFNSFDHAGVLDAETFGPILYAGNPMCTSSTIVRRRLFATVGTFRDSAAPAEDYDFWLRVAATGATFFYDPTPLVHYRVHAKQVSADLARMHEAEHRAHLATPGPAGDGGRRRAVLANDLRQIGYAKFAAGDTAGARSAYRAALRRRPGPQALAWSVALALPGPLRASLISAARGVKPSKATAATSDGASSGGCVAGDLG
jgi:glycosyltransferase involved in cell wall biosynthesis